MHTFLVEEENTIYEIDLECQKRREEEKKKKEKEQKGKE